ncbi:MAG: PD-(D/E)XK nuclease family protein [Candidatus Eisenbacteria bacterium]
MGRELRNVLSWSFSRHGAFQNCLRAYYYHYYGSWGGWSAEAAPETRRLYLLKNLKARHLWAGGIVHEAVAALLGRIRARQSGPAAAPEREAAVEAAIDRMRAEFRRSRSGEYVRDPKRITGLMEHHYAQAVADDEWKELADLVRRSMRTFLTGPYPRRLALLPEKDWLALEDLETFPLDEVPVYVKMDLAYRSSEGGILILDWKTGRRDPHPDGLQLGTYALHGTARWGVDPGSIEIREVNLNQGTEESLRISEESLAQARGTILDSIAAMRARLQDAGENRARVEDFPAQPDAKCRRCCFREVCPEYQALAAGV